MFYFHKVEYIQYLGEVTFLYVSEKISSSLQQCKNYKKNWSRFSKVMIIMYCHLFYIFIYNATGAAHKKHT